MSKKSNKKNHVVLVVHDSKSGVTTKIGGN
jgi:hypothetical protein